MFTLAPFGMEASTVLEVLGWERKLTVVLHTIFAVPSEKSVCVVPVMYSPLT